MVSTAATFCCLVTGASSSFLFSLPRFCPAAATLQGALGSAVPCNVLNEKHSKVVCPGRPHRQQSSWFWKYASCSFCGTPLRASSFEPQWFFPPHHSRVFSVRCSGPLLPGFSFFPSSLRLSSFFPSCLGAVPPFKASLAAFSAFPFQPGFPPGRLRS